MKIRGTAMNFRRDDKPSVLKRRKSIIVPKNVGR
jgi:hypothetical protein